MKSLRWRIRDARPPEQILEHYKLEKALAAQLRAASKSERRNLYSSLYDELFRSLPHHPQLVNRASAETRRRSAQRQARFLLSLVSGDSSILEVGCGDCLLATELAKGARAVYAVDVSEEMTKLVEKPENLHLILSDGCSIDIPPASVQLAFSNQLMEHLHPDDASEQLRNIYTALADGGRYFCITPNRMSGPHDVSRSFDDVATGFHLREYTVAELELLFRSVGFSGFRAYAGLDGNYVRVPLALIKVTELLLARVPARWRRALGPLAPFRAILGIRLLAIK
jgi:SAM-dependent methyltransferase